MGEKRNLSDAAAIDKIKELATSADICMFGTSLNKLPITARPMSTTKVDDEGNIWFISKKSSRKDQEIKADSKVQLFYASKGNSEYLNVFAEAEVMYDKNKAKEIWVPEAKAWLPGGVDDPELSIIKVTPIEAYYWDTKSNKLIALAKIAASIVTGKTMDDGVEGKLKI